MSGQFFDAMILVSTDKDVVIITHQNLAMESVGKCFQKIFCFY